MKLSATTHKLQQGERATIVALGDSLTYGWMVKKGYLDFLHDMLLQKYPSGACEIFNRGIPGDTAEGGLYRLKEHVIDLQPDAVFIQFALNDAFSGYSPEQFYHNITTIIQRLRQDTGAEILLLTSAALAAPEDSALAERYYAWLMRAAEKEQVPIALVHEYWKKKIAGGIAFGDLLQADLVHPTAEGYRLMAEAIMEVF